MKKRILALIAETIPVISAVISVSLISSPYDAPWIRRVISVTVLLAFLGVAFFFLGRALAGRDRAVRILGVLDCLAAAFIIGYYVLAIFVFGL